MMASYDVLDIGCEGQKVVIIDDFHPEFESLLQRLQQGRYGPGHQYYPGLQMPMDPAHLMPCAALIMEIMTNVFEVGANIHPVQCAASMVTTPPHELSVAQRQPHFDTVDSGRFALLHYMGGPDKGGTGFYRQRITGFEYVDDARYPVFIDAQERALKESQPDTQYMKGSDERFEKIALIEAKPNRMILYRSYSLHSCDIPDDLDLKPDPKTARLTINTFFQIM